MQERGFAQDAINVWFQDPVNGGSVWARPGFQQLTSSALESAVAQAVFGIYFSGTQRNFVFTNGKVYRQSGATSWTDVTPVGVTIETTGRIHVISFDDEMIVNDGVNEPWRGTNLSSTPITGTEIEINTAGSAWVARGKPTVHGGKLFFIVASIAATSYTQRIAWSEESSAATGYLQDGFTNSWDLLQSEVFKDTIYAIQGTNTGLYYFRQFSIGIIYGAVSADFVTASTTDGIANDVGIWVSSTAAAEYHGEVGLGRNFLWFLDSAGRPSRIRLGGRDVEPLWRQLTHRLRAVRQQVSGESVQSLDAWQFVYSPDMDKVVMLGLATAVTGSQSSSRSLYIFDAATGNYEGRWKLEVTTQPSSDVAGEFIVAIGLAQRHTALDDSGQATLIVAGGTGNATHVWHQTSQAMYGTDSVSLGDDGGAMHMSLTTMLTPDEQDVEFLVSDCSMEAGPDSATLTLDQYTPRGAATALSITGITNSDSIQSSHDHGIFRAGLHQFGRWWRGVFHWNVAAGSTPYFFERALITVKPRRTMGVTK